MPGPGEPLWLDEDRAWALALTEVEGDVCPDCGQPWSEASKIDNEYAYTAEVVRCHACLAGAQAAHAHQKRGGDARGIHVAISKRR
ncbi:hypothetical protein KQY30_20155 [Streptomyces sp. GMY02]|uniref:hypothetical protein n=1 Tax=Streptomyces sp. GMY02 TaxID=1333528 RepID=UPI001C2C0C28|nr:hypothetical protein [Streptomyces sp. GMY02]QXE36212.1 hypothetical protein KQY30_20155 [Streptomyces sp. GMY02]